MKRQEKLKELLIDFTCAQCNYPFTYDNGYYRLIIHHSNQTDTETIILCSAKCLHEWNIIKHELVIY